MKYRWLIGCFSLALVLVGCHDPAIDRTPAIERTAGKNKAGMEQYLNAHLLAVAPDSSKVTFITDGRLGIGDWGKSWQREFALETGGKFQGAPDHHSSSSFEVQTIGARSVLIKYQTKFDHRSFGKNLISIDEGEVAIAYKEKK